MNRDNDIAIVTFQNRKFCLVLSFFYQSRALAPILAEAHEQRSDKISGNFCILVNLINFKVQRSQNMGTGDWR